MNKDEGAFARITSAGLTKREYFAAAALQGILSNDYTIQAAKSKSTSNDFTVAIAEMSLDFADALLNAMEIK